MSIFREQLRPTQNFDVLFQRFIEPLHRAICGLIAELQGCQPEEALVILQAHALVGQALAFVVAHQAFPRRAQCKAIGSAEAERIADIVATMAPRSIAHFSAIIGSSAPTPAEAANSSRHKPALWAHK